MRSSSHITRETLKKKPVLIIDKTGVIGSDLCRLLHREFLPVFVSEVTPEKEFQKHVVHIPFRRKAPKIPENLFAHIFFIDSSNRYVRGMFRSVYVYAKSKNIPLSFVTSIYLKKPRNFDETIKSPLVQTFVTGDVFSLSHTDSPVYSILESAFREKKVLLHQHGLQEVYTASATDVAQGIVSVIFSKAATHPVINLYPDYPTTFLSLTRHILTIDPDVSADFTKVRPSYSKPIWYPNNGWHLTMRPLFEQVKDVYSGFTHENLSRGKIKKKLLPHFSLSPYLTGFGLSLMAAALLPFLLVFGSALLGKALTEKAVSQIEKTQYENSRSTAQSAAAAFGFGKNITDAFTPLTQIIGASGALESFSYTLDAGIKADELLVDLSYGLENYRASTEAIEREKARQLFASALQHIKAAILTMLQIEREGKLPEDLNQTLSTYASLGKYILATSDVLSDVLGYTEKKTYLVLFQNNNELRPGGGFIGSYGMLNIDQGKITKFTVHDVYDADGQLSAHVEPPYAIKEFMGAAHWYLRDSNFSPDFVENAGRAAYFLNLETRENVDGVFAIDTTFLSGILEATGPISIEEYGETVDSKNFSEKTQSEIEDNFFPGSQNKRTFLTAVSSDLSQRLLNGEGFSYPILLTHIANAVKGKHLLFAFADEDTQLPFTASNLSGALWDPRTETEGEIVDLLGLVEANIGLNKVNPYIERYIHQETEYTDEGLLKTNLSIRYKNTSTDSTKFGGAYKNYIQLVMPLDEDVTRVEIGGESKVLLTQEQLTATREQEGADVKGSIVIEKGEISNKRVVGFFVEVPQGREVIVAVSLQKQASTAGNPKVDYSLRLFKQPGRRADPYTFTFKYPSAYKLLEASKEMKGNNGEATTFFLLDSDKEFEISLGKK